MYSTTFQDYHKYVRQIFFIPFNIDIESISIRLLLGEVAIINLNKYFL